MNWLNIHTDTLRSSEFLGAEPLERATWLALLGWCATQENSGVISGAKDWTDRRWQQTCGVTKHEAETASDLYYFKGDSLVVNYYPVEKQAEVVAKREAGKRGGRPRKPLQTQEGKPSGKPCGLGELNLEGELSESEAETEGKGMEGKGKEGKDKKFIPPTLEEFVAYAQEILPKLNPEWQSDQITRCAGDKFDTYVEQNWCDGFGKKIKNWKLKAKNSMKFDMPYKFGTSILPSTKPKTLSQKRGY